MQHREDYLAGGYQSDFSLECILQNGDGKKQISRGKYGKYTKRNQRKNKGNCTK